MANKYRGEARLEIENVIYTLVFTANSIVSLEDRLKMGFIKILKVCGQEDTVSLSTLRVMLHEGLREKHKDITLDQCGEMVLTGGFGYVLEKILEAYTAAVTVKRDDDATANPPQPSQSKHGIGSDS